MGDGIELPRDVIMAETDDLQIARQRIIELGTELAHFARNSEKENEMARTRKIGGLVCSEDYWRKRCLLVENKFGVLMAKHQNDMNDLRADLKALRKISSEIASSCCSIRVGDSVFEWLDNEVQKCKQEEIKNAEKNKD